MKKYKDILKKVPKIPVLTIISVIVFFILLFVINKAFCTTDDFVYGKTFDSIAEFGASIKDFFTFWSGRVSIMMLTNLFMNTPIVFFKIANTLVFLIIIAAIYAIVNIIMGKTDSSIKRKIPFVSFGLIFLISVNVLSSGAIWVSGALNYLWPFACMLIAIIPFIAHLKDIKIKGIYYIFFILADLIACFSEQSGAILIAFGALTIIYSIFKKAKPSKLLIAHYILIIIITLISLKAPGNAARYTSELIQWYPSFEMLSLGDKLLQGYINVANHLVNNTTLICLIISLVLSYVIIRKKDMKKLSKIVSVLPVLYFGLKLTPLNVIFGQILTVDFDGLLNNLLYTFDRFSLINLFGTKEMLRIVLSMIVLGTMGVELIYAFKDKKDGIIAAILFAASICASLALSFSPTIFASANRIFIATDFLLVLVATLAITQFFKVTKKENNQMAFLITLLVISGLMYINLYVNSLYGIIW